LDARRYAVERVGNVVTGHLAANRHAPSARHPDAHVRVGRPCWGGGGIAHIFLDALSPDAEPGVKQDRTHRQCQVQSGHVIRKQTRRKVRGGQCGIWLVERYREPVSRMLE
jgi:hypothetical protein